MAKLKKPTPKNLVGVQSLQQQQPKKALKKPSWKNKSGVNDPESSDADTAEAIDIDITEDTQVDTQEISDFVKKLGLNKFTSSFSASPKSESKNLNNKSQKNFKKPESDVDSSPQHKTESVGSKSEKSKKMDKVTGAKKNFKGDTPTATPTPADTVNKSNKKQKKKPAKIGQDINDNKTTPKNQPSQKIIIKPGGRWFEDELDDDDVSSSKERHQNEDEQLNNMKPKQLRKDEIETIQKTANALLEADIQAYRTLNMKGGNKSDFEWMEKIMKSGTLPDKMAAFIVRIQDSPIHSLNYLTHLISMIKVQGKEQCMMTADTVRDLFLEDLLPPNRQLIPFESRSSQLHNASKKQLIQWIFEDRLKGQYLNYIEALRRMGSDTVEKLRGKAISIVYKLLVAHPELESMLLQSLVNKLGDPSKKMGSRALFYLKKLLYEHPKMKMIVIGEVERLLFRNNIAKRAQYYGICFMNLINLEGEHASLAHKLITVYLAFFKACIKTGDIDTKMMSGLLTGINRAFPQAKEYGFQFTESLDTLYKIVQLSQFSIGVQALSILFQITDVEANPAGADRFYRVLYQKLQDDEFVTTSHNMQFLNLIFKAMKTDNCINRVTGFTKRLLQISQNVPANLACAILFLLSEVSKSHPGSLKLGGLSNDEVENAKIAEEIQQVSDSDDEDEEAGSALGKQQSKRSLDLAQLMKSTNMRIAIEDTSKKLQTINNTTVHKPITVTGKEENDKAVHIVFSDDGKPDIKPDLKPVVTEYSPIARNPSYCGAEFSLAYELTALTKHFHPSVALFAQTLANRKTIKYDGNPLKDFTLSRFLERFVYRNAKAKKDRPDYRPQGLRSVPVNSETYLKTDEDQIPEDERFFYKFFKTKKEDIDANKPEKDDDDMSDAGSVSDDEFDNLMSNYFKSVKGGDDDSDEDEEIDGEDIDFAAGVSVQSGKSKKRKHEEESEDEDEEPEEDEDSGADDDVDDFIDMDDEPGFEEGSDNDEVGFLEDDDDDEIMSWSSKSKKGGRKGASKSMKGIDMFAPAEQFAEMLEENADESVTGSQTLINKDRADPKQLKWEIQKDRWVKGYTGNSKPSYKGSNKKKLKRK